MSATQKEKYWIWSTTLENWKILLETNKWATRYARNVEKIKKDDRIAFHVLR